MYLKSCQKQLLKLTRLSSCALRTSYKVVFRIAKATKQYTVWKTLLIGHAKDVCQEMLGKIAAQNVSQVPMSNDTIARRIHNLTEDKISTS